MTYKKDSAQFVFESPTNYIELYRVRKLLLIVYTCLMPLLSMGQLTQYVNGFDYKNINTQSFIPMTGWNNNQKHILTILKHSFELQEIISHPTDTLFIWNSLIGIKSIYTKDSLLLCFIRPADDVKRPCILLTHGNNAKYRSSWSELMNFYAIDLAMRGYCVAYYENPSSFEAKEISATLNDDDSHLLANARNAFYNGFQSAVAANIYVKHHAALYHIDTTRLFAGGYSFGAFLSLMMATADAGKNFTDTLFNRQGKFTAKSIYNDPYTKNIRNAFSIGGGLPKDDTIADNNSKMGEFLDSEETDLSFLFFHGRTDNFVSFDITKFSDTLEDPAYFWGEGPRALMNKIEEHHYPVASRLFVNCRGGHSFLTSVCGYSNPYCLPQWQWQYLLAPPNELSNTSTYFQDAYRDTLLHYIAYMHTQIHDVDGVICDFLQPAITGNPSVFPTAVYYIQPTDSFTYARPEGYYTLRTRDCEGNVIVISSSHENSSADAMLRIYPNPTNGQLTIESRKAIRQITLYSLLGEQLQQINYPEQQPYINLSHLESGQYLLSISLSDRIISKKVSVFH